MALHLVTGVTTFCVALGGKIFSLVSISLLWTLQNSNWFVNQFLILQYAVAK